METNERISPDEAAAALAEARRSRARVAWSGYPWWYWVATGAGMGAASFAIDQHGWLGYAIPLAAAATLIFVARAACRARGVCTGWVHGPMTARDGALLYGPAALLIIASAEGSKFASWPPAVGAVLVFVVFAVTGLAQGARAARS